MKINKQDKKNLKFIIEKYEQDIVIYTYITKLLKKVLKENADR
ncbi:hypothetical protein [Enterococcus sp. BWB1-3]|nr:hypothetical protein [Enterococcus sp. BWB1-3]